MNEFKSTNTDGPDIPKGGGSLLTSREFQIPLNTLFTQVFSLAGPLIRRYKIPKEQESTEFEPYYDFGELEEEEIRDDEVKSLLGTPVRFWMKFAGAGRDYNKRINGDIKKVKRSDLMLPFTSVATFSRAHRKTVTYMSGANEPVIEEYGFEAWDIRIQGLILNNEGNKTIEQWIEALEKFEGLSDSIPVEGGLFDVLKIRNIAFDNIKWLPRRELNLESVLPFEIDAMSDGPVELLNPT